MWKGDVVASLFGNGGHQQQCEFYDDAHVRVYEVDEKFLTEKESVLQNIENCPLPEFWQQQYRKDQVKNWDLFYKRNSTNFFRDRQWLKREFPQLKDEEIRGRRQRLVEIGCGVGNTILPILMSDSDNTASIEVFGFDCAPRAIQLLTQRWCDALNNKDLTSTRKRDLLGCGLWDIARETEPSKFFLKSTTHNLATTQNSTEELTHKDKDCLPHPLYQSYSPIPNFQGTCDFVLLIFVLSALPPEAHLTAIRNCVKLLKPGGRLVIRDYGRYDQKEIRFASRKNAKLGNHLYVRQDGTLAYYFLREELRELLNAAADDLEEEDMSYCLREFTNRKTLVKLQRVWIQALIRRKEVATVAAEAG